MEGTNELILCPDEMKRAMEIYLNHILLKSDDLQVDDVAPERIDGATTQCFRIKFHKLEKGM